MSNKCAGRRGSVFIKYAPQNSMSPLGPGHYQPPRASLVTGGQPSFLDEEDGSVRAAGPQRARAKHAGILAPEVCPENRSSTGNRRRREARSVASGRRTGLGKGDLPATSGTWNQQGGPQFAVKGHAVEKGPRRNDMDPAAVRHRDAALSGVAAARTGHSPARGRGRRKHRTHEAQ